MIYFPLDGKRGCVNYDFTPSFAARRSASECAVSSVVEHLPDTEGVTGSNPVSRTIPRTQGFVEYSILNDCKSCEITLFHAPPIMNPRNSVLLSFAGVALLLASCAQNPNDPKLVKTHPEYKNPYQPGTYDFFMAEKTYPKTYDSWTNQELLAQTKASNSWLKIDLETQRGKLMNGEEVVIDYPICSGRSTHPTPPGTFKILEKISDKSSNKYGRIYDAEGKVVNSDADMTQDAIPEGGKFVGAPMHYWMRLTGDGVGHHIGPVKRVPSSHACIRGPQKTMPIVYSKLAVGSKVVVE